MKVLVTGFDAFAGADRNPAQEIVTALAEAPVIDDAIECHCVVLPTIYADAAVRVGTAIENVQPELVVMFGLAAASEAVRLERFALNMADSTTPDNAGGIRCGEPVVVDGPAAHMSRLDLGYIASCCEAELGSRPEVSNHAGAFVCNFVYYSVLNRLAVPAGGADALFVHVPWRLPARGAVDGGQPGRPPHLQWARAVIRAAAAARRSTTGV